MKVDTDINSYFKEYKEGAQDELDKLEVKLTEAKTMAGTAKLRIDKDIKFINKAFQINLSDEDIAELEELVSEPTAEDTTAQIESSEAEQASGSVLPQANAFSRGLNAIIGNN